MTFCDSPGRLLRPVIDFLGRTDFRLSQEVGQTILDLVGRDSDWERAISIGDPVNSKGRTPESKELRVMTEELILELEIRGPGLIASGGRDDYLLALHYASMARKLLCYHADLGADSGTRIARLLGIRDAMMADNLKFILSRESVRGKVLVFAHNSHLKRGMACWQMGGETLKWWPVGSHLNAILGARYAAIGMALGISDANGIGQPEDCTLESILTAGRRSARLIPTHMGRRISARALERLTIRSGSSKNPTYFPLTGESLTDFDWLAVIDRII
jgi:erythromycin esterase